MVRFASDSELIEADLVPYALSRIFASPVYGHSRSGKRKAFNHDKTPNVPQNYVHPRSVR